jgi:hypothetical protein
MISKISKNLPHSIPIDGLQESSESIPNFVSSRMNSKRGGPSTNKKTKKKKKIARTPDIIAAAVVRDGYSTSTTAR